MAMFGYFNVVGIFKNGNAERLATKVHDNKIFPTFLIVEFSCWDCCNRFFYYCDLVEANILASLINHWNILLFKVRCNCEYNIFDNLLSLGLCFFSYFNDDWCDGLVDCGLNDSCICWNFLSFQSLPYLVFCIDGDWISSPLSISSNFYVCEMNRIIIINRFITFGTVARNCG